MLAGLPILGLGIGLFIKTLLVYRGDYFAPLSVAGLLHKVKVSNVRPVPARMRGTIIGRGVPGLIWSEDFVMRDGTGILFLDYRQPLRIWEWLFGLFCAGEFAGKTVEVVGWFRRARCLTWSSSRSPSTASLATATHVMPDMPGRFCWFPSAPA